MFTNQIWMQKWIVIFFLCLTGSVVLAQTEDAELADPDTLEAAYYGQLLGLTVSEASHPLLYKNVYDWLGTPYRYGGDTKRGIDCSSFTSKVYNAAYNVSVPSSSRAVWQSVIPIDKEELQEGDFVFFKIRRGQISHIGIYLGNYKFAHASLSSGVIISDLNDAYYRRYFYKGGRLSFTSQADDTAN